MPRLFADTSYWIAILNQRDSLHETAIKLSKARADLGVSTRENVLAELLTYFADEGRHLRAAAAELVQRILDDESITVHGNNQTHFLATLQFYIERSDKQYSFTDCSSMLVMHSEGLVETLSADHHFEQEGFLILLK